MKIGNGKAPGKIILMGEHSVVYDKSAIALPFYNADVRCQVETIRGNIAFESYYQDEPINVSSGDLVGVKKLTDITLEYLKQKKRNLKIIFNSTIPPKRGLGSSAAVSVALVRALFDKFDTELTDDILEKLVHVAESIHHHNPSGLDAATIINERFMFFDKEKGSQVINAKLDAYLIVADSGIDSNTKASVSNVIKLLEKHPESTASIIDELGIVSEFAYTSILRGDVFGLGQFMSRSHKLLKTLGVSSTKLDFLVSVALNNKALGAKLTGGGNGGCIIALSDSKEQAKIIYDKLLEESAKDVWIINLQEVTNE